MGGVTWVTDTPLPIAGAVTWGGEGGAEMLTYTGFQRIKNFRIQCKLSAGVRISHCIQFGRGTKVVYNLKRHCLEHVCRSRKCTRLLWIMDL